jgi:adenine phosphoribosyltransferase
MSIEYLLSLIRDVPDFPKKGIVFKDITPIFQDPRGLRTTIDLFVDRLRDRGVERVIGIESRGFLFGAPVAADLGVGLGLVRKAGKLPYTRVSRTYDLEYGSATLEAHIDMVEPGMKVVILDDLLATGGTALATLELCREVGADVIEIGFLIELSFLPGRSRLEEAGVEVFAPIVF